MPPPHVVVGTCFLQGLHPDFDASSSALLNEEETSQRSSTTACIELTSSKRLQVDGQEMPILQAKVTYSTLYAFSLVFNDDICKGIVYDSSGQVEKVAINLQGLTDFFELKCMTITDKCIIDVLNNFARRKETLLRLRKLQIEPDTFYATGKNVPVKVFESFSRQELAFNYYDELLEEGRFSTESEGGDNRERKNPIKLFTFESLMTGKRQFLVADMESFVLRYLSLEGSKRHCYEIIREDFPCRLYFDLEFSIPSNPNVCGTDLVARWIHIITWKLYEVFGLVVGPDNFIDLDSSNAVKFSRHLIVILHDGEDTCTDHVARKSRKHRANVNDVLRPIPGKELLFRNNIEVGKFIDIVVSDVLMASNDVVMEPQDNILPRLHAGKTPHPAHETLFVWNSDKTAKTCFVDLGVYTRNRAFRLLSSCKFGKTSRLRVATPTPTAIVPGSGDVVAGGSQRNCFCDTSRVNQFVRGNTSSNVAHNELFARILKRTFVVPDVVMHNGAYYDDIKGEISSLSALCLLPSFNDVCTALPLWLHSPRSSLAMMSFSRMLSDPSVRSPMSSSVTKRVRSKDTNSDLHTTVSTETLASSRHSFPIGFSPFPSVDEFVTKLASRGGAVGRISQWLLKRTTTVTTTVTSSAPASVPGTTTSHSSLANTASLHPSTSTNPADTGTSQKNEGSFSSSSSSHTQRGNNLNLDLASRVSESEENITSISNTNKRIRVNETKLQPSIYSSSTIISLEYQILGNRFCQNINRPHKSNNIMFEVNLNSGFARQKCWDVDCRSFRSAPMYLPIQSCPSLLDINEAVGDIVIQRALLQDPSCL